ncbi:MAG: flagellar hook-length control protein FliK [Selenomonadaceae bacterium]|nr:flagellar hook-length control protein FliK [Selenomonadaceae bacterium]
MKAENLMMQQPAQAVKQPGAGKTSSLRSAVQAKNAAQGKKVDNAFDNALNDAKSAQKDMRADVKEAPKAEAANAADKADVKPTDAKEVDAKAAEAAKSPEEAAAEAASELPKSGKKDKTAKTGDAKDAETVEGEPEAESGATTLNAMLLSLVGSAQAQPNAEAQTAVEMEPTADTKFADMPTPDVALAADEQQTFPTGTLDALIPQDAAKEQQAAQNQQLMDMLSENGAEMRLTSEQLAGLSSKAQETMPEQTAQPVLDEAQLAPQAQTAAPSIKTGEAVAEQPETMAVLQNAAQNTPVARNERTAASETRSEKSEGLFAGVPLTIEDAVLDKVQTDARQNLGDMLKRQPQRQNTQGGDAMDEMTRISGGKDIDAPQTARGEAQSGAQQAQTQTNGAGAIAQGMSFTETMNASATAEAAPAQQVQDPYNVMQQIVDQARLIRSDANTEMVIRLNPEHLGELTLRVAVTASGAINATFHTENAQVRGLLESSMIQLKQELQQQGLKVNNVDVQSGLSQDFFAQSQAGQQGYPQSQHSARNQAADRAAFENDADALTVNTAVSGAAAMENTANVGDSDGVNYLV